MNSLLIRLNFEWKLLTENNNLVTKDIDEYFFSFLSTNYTTYNNILYQTNVKSS
jgi:hypothetical protein